MLQRNSIAPTAIHHRFQNEPSFILTMTVRSCSIERNGIVTKANRRFSMHFLFNFVVIAIRITRIAFKVINSSVSVSRQYRFFRVTRKPYRIHLFFLLDWYSPQTKLAHRSIPGVLVVIFPVLLIDVVRDMYTFL